MQTWQNQFTNMPEATDGDGLELYQGWRRTKFDYTTEKPITIGAAGKTGIGKVQTTNGVDFECLGIIIVAFDNAGAISPELQARDPFVVTIVNKTTGVNLSNEPVFWEAFSPTAFRGDETAFIVPGNSTVEFQITHLANVTGRAQSYPVTFFVTLKGNKLHKP